MAPYIQSAWEDFNPRLREGGDQDAFRARLNPWRFQSTPPRRRRLKGTIQEAEDLDFNPRLREGGDCKGALRSSAMMISIHASAKEATALALV